MKLWQFLSLTDHKLHSVHDMNRIFIETQWPMRSFVLCAGPACIVHIVLQKYCKRGRQLLFGRWDHFS